MSDQDKEKAEAQAALLKPFASTFAVADHFDVGEPVKVRQKVEKDVFDALPDDPTHREMRKDKEGNPQYFRIAWAPTFATGRRIDSAAVIYGKASEEAAAQDNVLLAMANRSESIACLTAMKAVQKHESFKNRTMHVPKDFRQGSVTRIERLKE